MPPRFTYWTIILDGQPTAFRAAEREQLLPTLKQLQTKNPDAVLKWFAHGRVWESPEDLWQLKAKAREAARDAAVKERRGREWRPGGEHKDPRERFKKETFQARKRRDKKAANLAGAAGGPVGVARGFPPSPKRFGPSALRQAQGRPEQRRGTAGSGPSRATPRGGGTSSPARDAASPGPPGPPAPSHKTRQPHLRKPR
jgi:hypothetical protein